MHQFLKISFIALFSVLFSLPLLAREINYETPQTKEFILKISGDIKSKKIIEISAIKLAREYRSNEVSADVKFKNNFIFIQGIVDTVSKDAFDNIVVSLKTDNQFLSVMARFDKNVSVITGLEGGGEKVVTQKIIPLIDAVSMIKHGSKVHLICRGDGYFMGIPQLKICDTISR